MFGVPDPTDSSKVIASFGVTKVGEPSKIIFNWEAMGISAGERVPRNALDQALRNCVKDCQVPNEQATRWNPFVSRIEKCMILESAGSKVGLVECRDILDSQGRFTG